MSYKLSISFFTPLVSVLTVITLSVICISCKKYLETKRYQNQAVPTTLKDLQAVLEHNETNSGSPGYLEFIADNFYITTQTWNNRSLNQRNNYVWSNDAKTDNIIWNGPYQTIYRANFVLDFLPEIVINESERSEFNNVKGQALFFRSFMFYQLAQLFCRPYSTSAGTDPGIVLRLTAAVEVPSTRTTVKNVYEQVIADLKTATGLLPTTAIVLTRPNKAAALGLLARVYLSMGDYANAALYADAALSLKSTLLDYNSLNPATNPVLPTYTNNPEILFVSYESNAPDVFGSSHLALIDSFLYQSYNNNDLRKTVFFNNGIDPNTYYWRGAYFNFYGSNEIFDGIATDEIYLIRAESRARTGNVSGAMDDLNALLRLRYKTGTFSDLSAPNPTDALNKILPERRKELLFRGLRWTDLRRFNLEAANITLRRIVNGANYDIPANNLRWVLLIPDAEIIRSGIAQNPR